MVTCDSESVAVSVNTELRSSNSSGRLLKRDNLDGSAATWIVVATAGISALPKILDGLAKVIDALKVRSIKIGEQEIRNPTPTDLRAFRKSLKA